MGEGEEAWGGGGNKVKASAVGEGEEAWWGGGGGIKSRPARQKQLTSRELLSLAKQRKRPVRLCCLMSSDVG